MTTSVDLTAFPIVRLDQISELNDSLLEKAILEVEEILQDQTNPKMSQYLQKQLDGMRKESMRRKAESRIQDLLSGAKSLLDTDYSHFDVSAPAQPSHVAPVPPKANTAVAATTSFPKPAINIPNMTSYNSLPRSAPTVPSLSAAPAALSKSSITSNIPTSPLSSRSASSAAAEDHKPSKKAVAIMHRQFATEFIVAATERKRRFYPQKKLSAEEVEEQKEREKKERREEALRRLAQRKREREEVMRKAREKRKKAAKNGDSSTGGSLGDEETEEESVSGGDDDPLDRGMQLLPSGDVQAITPHPPVVQAPASSANTHSTSSSKLPPRKRETAPSSSSVSVSGAKADNVAGSVDKQRPADVDENFAVATGNDDIRKDANSMNSSNEGGEGRESEVPLLPSSLLEKTSAALNMIRQMKMQKASVNSEHKPSSMNSSTKASAKTSLGTSNSMKKTPKPAITPTTANVQSLTQATESRGERGEIVNDPLSQHTNIDMTTEESTAGTNKASMGECVSAPDTQSRGIGRNEAVDHSASEAQQQNLPVLIDAGVGLGVEAELTEVRSDSRARSRSNSRANSRCENRSHGSRPGSRSGSRAGARPFTDSIPLHPLFTTPSCPLFTYVDSVYVFGYPAAALPGLRVWKLEEVGDYAGEVKWSVDMALYRPDIQAVATNRDVVGMQVSLLLVKLTQFLCPLLLGNMPGLDTREAFLEAWVAGVEGFDRLVEGIDLESCGDDVNLQAKVSVCEYGYEICAKTEFLLKSALVSSSERRNMLGTGQRSGSRGGGMGRMRVQEWGGDGLRLWVEGMQVKVVDTESGIDSSAVDVDGSDNNDNHADLSKGSDSNPHLDSALVVASLAEPSPLPLPLPPSSSTAGSESIRGQAADGEVATPPPPLPIPQLLREERLADHYPVFAAIFPMAYNMVNIQRADTVQLLHDCIQTCLKVHVEWLEVMKDFSTVFCVPDALTPAATPASTPAQTPSSTLPSLPTHNNNSGYVYNGTPSSLHYQVKSSRSDVMNIISDVMNSNYSQIYTAHPNNLGLKLTWNLLWTWSTPRISNNNYCTLLTWQRINHFRGARELTGKDKLKKNLERYDIFVKGRNGGGSAEWWTGWGGEVMPLTFLLPLEYSQFIEAFTAGEMRKKEAKGGMDVGVGDNAQTKTNTDTPQPLNFWIMKPVGLSRGRGIRLLQDLGDLTYNTTCVVQKYIEQPLCINNYKFDLRLYIVVLSFSPLEVYIYTDGFARISTVAYSTDPQNAQNKFIHLTNSSIQKHNTQSANVYETIKGSGAKSVSGRRASSTNPLSKHRKDRIDEEEELGDIDGDGQDGDDEEHKEGGSKIALLGVHGLWHMLQDLPAPAEQTARHGKNINTAVLWEDICTLVLKSLLTLNDKISSQPNCFELFGYDVIIDASLRPWLLEVNASPSLSRDNPLDFKVKNSLIRDIVVLLDLLPYNREHLVKILQRRMQTKSFLTRNDPWLEADLRAILGDRMPRKYGDLPKNMGLFQRLAPSTDKYEKLLRIKKKMFKSNA